MFRFAQALAEENAGDLFRMIDEVMRNGRDPSVFIKDLSYHMRTLLLAKCCPEELCDITDLTDEDADEFRRQAEDFSISRMMTILDLFMKAEAEMRFSSTPRLALENVCLKCCVRTSAPDAQALNDRIDELEKKISQLTEQIAGGKAFTNGIISEKKTVQKAEKQKASLKSEEGNTFPEPAPHNVQSAWKETMNRLSKEDPRIWGILTQGKITCTGGKEIKWMPLKAEGSEYFIAPLNREEKKNEIMKILQDVTGTEYEFSTSAVKDSTKDQDNSEEIYIQQLYNTFGKEPVDIVDHL